MDNNTLDVVVKSRDGIVFQAKCRSVSSFNKVGKFDILPRHANFITLLEKELILVRETGEATTINLDNGVAHVKENKITVYLGVNRNPEKF